jgi:hypothetical protein
MLFLDGAYVGPEDPVSRRHRSRGVAATGFHCPPGGTGAPAARQPHPLPHGVFAPNSRYRVQITPEALHLPCKAELSHHGLEEQRTSGRQDCEGMRELIFRTFALRPDESSLLIAQPTQKKGCQISDTPIGWMHSASRRLEN